MTVFWEDAPVSTKTGAKSWRNETTMRPNPKGEKRPAPGTEGLTPLFTYELLRRAAQAALSAEIWVGSGLRSGDKTTIVHAVHRRRVAINLTGRGCLVDRRRSNGRRRCGLTRLSQACTLGSKGSGSTEHDEQNEDWDTLHGISPVVSRFRIVHQPRQAVFTPTLRQHKAWGMANSSAEMSHRV